MDINIFDLNKEEPSCKGRFYKLRINSYLGSRKEIVYKETLVPIKKMSCSGCEFCGWIDDYLREEIYDYDLRVDEKEKKKDGDIYELKWKESYDYESGYKEFDGFYFEKIK